MRIGDEKEMYYFTHEDARGYSLHVFTHWEQAKIVHADIGQFVHASPIRKIEAGEVSAFSSSPEDMQVETLGRVEPAKGSR